MSNDTRDFPSDPIVIGDSFDKPSAFQKAHRAPTPKFSETKETAAESELESGCSTIKKWVTMKIVWGEEMNEETNSSVFEELTDAVESYCQEQGFESQFDEIESNVEFYDFLGPQDRVEGFICG